MNPQCASCKKTVYPMEKLNCLDKFWHKGCFRCQVCGMTLNMKNYKGYNKLPYCSAHYPTTSFTAVADTPENKRLSDNTKKQSLLQYHAEFEKSKGTYQAVADDLETKRASKSAQIASDLAYKNMLSQREAQEQRRPDQVIEDERRNPRHRVVGRISDYDPAENQPSPYSARSQMPTIYDSNKGGRVEEPAGPRRVGKISDYDPEQNQWGSIGQGYEERVPGRFEPTNQYNPKPASAPAPQHTWQPPSKTRQQQKEERLQQQKLIEQQLAQQQQQLLAQQQKQQQQQQAGPQYAYGAQPGFGQKGYNSARQDHVQIVLNAMDLKGSYHAPPPQNQPVSPSWNPQPAPGYGQIFSQPGVSSNSLSPGPCSTKRRDPQQPWPSRQVPQQYRQSGPGQQRGQGQAAGFGQAQKGGPNMAVQPPPPQPAMPPPPPAASKISYRALYDYNAADEDEVSFVEGDIVIDATIIDDGWMEGRIQRTNVYGMLPSNYVEKC